MKLFFVPVFLSTLYIVHLVALLFVFLERFIHTRILFYYYLSTNNLITAHGHSKAQFTLCRRIKQIEKFLTLVKYSLCLATRKFCVCASLSFSIVTVFFIPVQNPFSLCFRKDSNLSLIITLVIIDLVRFSWRLLTLSFCAYRSSSFWLAFCPLKDPLLFLIFYLFASWVNKIVNTAQHFATPDFSILYSLLKGKIKCFRWTLYQTLVTPVKIDCNSLFDLLVLPLSCN